ncbi:MAG: MurR/RpiR family transcriptional regulator [Deltaproteobacteria bacterium]|nr:MurR/RpiR family transcriptional regulator [Deltaproteobacteria bacterium]
MALLLHQQFKGKGVLLTQSQRKLLEYILGHEDESVFLKIGDLARQGNVSQATVVRLAKTLGFKGFPEFQRELQRLFRNKFTTISRLQNTVKKVAGEKDIVTKVLQTDIENIAQTLQQTSILEFRQFVKGIASADRIFIVGLRSAHALAIFLGVALEFLQKNVWVLQPGIGDMWDRLLGLRKKDLVIGISFPRYTKQTVEVLRFAKHKGVKTLAITDTLISPLAPFADHVLTARFKMDSFIESFTAPLSLINAVVTALGVQDKKTTLTSLKALEEVWKNQEIYYNTGKRGKVSTTERR